VNAGRGARARVRAELTREITTIARRHLATQGAAALSVRAVAREMGMVSSAVYRYFPSRDELLTALIIEGYNALGAAVEEAEGACPREDYHARWLAACRGLRAWALAHPHEYALVYGSPVPGYHAPEHTIGPASRAAAVLGRIVADACRADALAEPVPALTPLESFAADAARLRETVLAGVPDEVAARALAVWAGVFGMVSFELFGQFENVITEREGFYEHAVTALGRLVGLPR
jgi:AcrR family transcriptional regulator